MKQTKFFDIEVPELGDRPDITQVSEAIQDLEDALAGTVEYVEAQFQGGHLSLTSATRVTKRTAYHTGMTFIFTTRTKLDIGSITEVSVDGLNPMPAELKFIVDQDDSAIVVFEGTKFTFKHAPMPRSNAIDSSSEHFVATSRAVKTLNDNKAEKTVQVIAGNGLTGGGDLTSNKTINVVSADAGIVVNADNIKLNVVNAINSTDAIRPASANSAKTAYDRGTEGLNKANEAISLANSNNTAMDNKKVNRAGDTMTGELAIRKSGAEHGLILGDGSSPANAFIKAGHMANPASTGHNLSICGLNGINNPLSRFNVYSHNSYFSGEIFAGADKRVYHTGNKPTKADVGLSSVPNYPVTSSVSDASNEKFATAGAVKQAYDIASSGINEANTKVSKSGDTMTGHLRFDASSAERQIGGSDTANQPYIYMNKNEVGIYSLKNKTSAFRYNADENIFRCGVNAIFGGNATATKFLGPLQGNADTTTKLATARQINGTNFDGTANITTANWGTARNITIGNSTKSVNGSGNVGWSLSEIGAMGKEYPSPLSGSAGWAIIARVTMPNNASTAKIQILGGQGYNVGSYTQTALDEIIIRSGNNAPKGINVVLYKMCGTASNILDLGWKEVSGDEYDIYAKSGNYARTGIVCHYYCSSNASVKLSDNPQNLGTETPAGITAGRIVSNYHSDNKPTKADVGLGDVNNWTATSAINDSSNSKYATAGAVKTAYDKGVEALNKPYSKSESDGRYKPKNRGLFMNVDVPERVWSSSAAMSGKTPVGGVDVNTGSTPGYIALSSSTSTLDLFIDGDMYVNEGRNKVYSDGNKPTAGDVGAYTKAESNSSFIPTASKGSLPGNTIGNTSGWNASGYDPGSYSRAYSGYSGVTFATPKVGGSTNQILMEMSYNGGFYLHSNTDSKGWTSHKVYTSSAKPTASDVGLGNVPNTKHTAGIESNTVAVRDASGDINARLLKTNYADQSTMSGAIAFRINNGSDNFTRYCNSNTAVRNWLSTYSKSETDAKMFGASATLLWSGRLNTVNQTMNLSSDYTQFKFIAICGDTSGYGCGITFMFPVQILRDGYGGVVTGSRQYGVRAVNNTQFKINNVFGGTTTDYVERVYGVK